MYKINTHNISGVRNWVNNPDWRVVMTNYVIVSFFAHCTQNKIFDNLMYLKKHSVKLITPYYMTSPWMHTKEYNLLSFEIYFFNI